jgi:hypothetical protein
VDVADDLANGRFTFVGNTLIGAGEREAITPEEASRRLAIGLLHPACSEGVWLELRKVADLARAAVEPPVPAPIPAILDALDRRPDALRARTHEAGVRWVFEGYIDESPGMTEAEPVATRPIDLSFGARTP